jgi:PAS domain S-box-containing protein
VVAETKALFAGGESIGYDRLFKNGRHVSVRANPAPGGGSVIVCADITALKQAEAEVRRSEAILRSILDQSPISFALKDTDRRFLMVNKVGADWFGFDREKMIGAPSEAINPTDQADMFAAADRRVLESGEPIRPFEYRDEAPFRAPMDLVVYKFPVLGAEGELIGVGTIQTDITERKRAEQELHKAYTIIRESVQYASKMQRALLPPEADLEALGDHLVIWEPRDVVGGDLFWLRRTEGGLLLIVGDGTGHGVPGAFMTLVATSALNQALLEHPDGDPARLLRHMNGHVKYMLRQDVVEGEADDGMELGLCLIDASGGITFAGARFSLLEVADGEARELKGDKGGIGYRRVPVAAAFTNHRLTPAPGAAYYLVTDGFVDQVGGEKRRAFGKRRLLQKLVALRALPMAAQREALLAALADYRGTEPRRDDVTLVGFRPV